MPGLVLVAVLGTVGFSTIGTLLAAMTAHLRAREVMLPLLLFPLTVPVILGSVRATEALLSGRGTGRGRPLAEAAGWASTWSFWWSARCLFEFVLEE